MNTIKLKDATIIDVVIEHELLDEYMSDLIQCYYDVTIKFDNGTAIVIESFTEPYGQCCGIMSLKDLFFNLVIVDNTERTFAEIFMDAFVPNIYGGCVMTISTSNQHKDSFTIKTELDDNFNSIIASPGYPNLSSDELLATISSHLRKGELQSSQSNDVYYLLHNGLYRKDFYPLAFESHDGDDPYWHETHDLADATFFMSKHVAEEARKQALDDEQGTNWYDRDVVIVALRGDFSLDGGQLEVTDFVETLHEGYYTLKL